VEAILAALVERARSRWPGLKIDASHRGA
jgi:hypothetical protein